MFPELADLLAAMADAITALSANHPDTSGAIARMNETRTRLAAMTGADLGPGGGQIVP